MKESVIKGSAADTTTLEFSLAPNEWGSRIGTTVIIQAKIRRYIQYQWGNDVWRYMLTTMGRYIGHGTSDKRLSTGHHQLEGIAV